MVDASTAADAAAEAISLPIRERVAIATVTAVLETSAPTMPATVSQRRSPSKRIATKPTKDSAQTSTTKDQIVRGFNTPHGP